uniref:eIF-4F 25 kDa subunit n=1 Tax=Panagrellus redivivus TaxID=6233 RepID=A0A7E4UTB5_PANRE
MFRWINGLRGIPASDPPSPNDSGITEPESPPAETEPVNDAPIVQNDDNKPPEMTTTTPPTPTPSPVVEAEPITVIPEVKGPEGDAVETPNNPEQDAIARALLRQTPVDDLSEMFKNSASFHTSHHSTAPQVQYHPHPLVRPAVPEESGATHEQQMALVKREASVLRFRELWEILPPTIPSRHPLHSRWVLWFLKGDRTKDWEECLRKVTVFDSIEGFWSVANHIISPSQLSWGSDFYVFREGIRPMWEDENNVKGGRWLVYVEKAKRAQALDHYWMELLIALVGEQFGEDGASISGAVVNIRQKGDKVALWTQDATKDATNYRIGKVLYEALGVKDGEIMRYEVHKDASARTGSTVKPRIVLPLKHMRLNAQQIRDLSVATGETPAPVIPPQAKFMFPKHCNASGGNFSFEDFLDQARQVQAVLR